jgi:hypothetical protein
MRPNSDPIDHLAEIVDHVVGAGHYKLRRNAKVTVTSAAPAADKEALAV